MEKFNQAEKLEINPTAQTNSTPLNNKQDLKYDSAKEKDPIEEEYNDFEENISVDSKNWN